jgi:hypothetical protein
MVDDKSSPHGAPILAIPVVIRLGLFLIGPVVAYAFHKLAHSGIHLSIHKIEWLKQLAVRFKYLPDLLMIAALVILHFVSE